MSQSTSGKPIHRIFIILSIIGFAGSTLIGLVGLFSSAGQQPKSNPATATSVKEPQLEAKEQGYELVLQREPENQVALEGLVQVRLQMKDEQGAVVPLEKLVKLNPEREDYQALLTQVKQQVGNKGDR